MCSACLLSVCFAVFAIFVMYYLIRSFPMFLNDDYKDPYIQYLELKYRIKFIDTNDPENNSRWQEKFREGGNCPPSHGQKLSTHSSNRSSHSRANLRSDTNLNLCHDAKCLENETLGIKPFTRFGLSREYPHRGLHLTRFEANIANLTDFSCFLDYENRYDINAPRARRGRRNEVEFLIEG